MNNLPRCLPRSPFQQVGAFPSLADGCRAVGIRQPEHTNSGLTRVQALDERHGKLSGSVMEMANGYGFMCFNWKTGLKAVVRFDRPATLHRPVGIGNAPAPVKIVPPKEIHEIAASVAAKIVANSVPLNRPHAYIERKGLTGMSCQFRELSNERLKHILADTEIRQNLASLGSRLLVVPMIGASRAIMSVQLIDERGLKRFLSGSSTKGAIWVPPYITESPPILGIAEGAATALSVKALCGIPCVAAISAGNLAAGSETATALFPEAHLAFYADSDPSHVGEAKAKAAWLGLSPWRRYSNPKTGTPGIVKPAFSSKDIDWFRRNHKTDPTDFNDLLLIRSL